MDDYIDDTLFPLMILVHGKNAVFVPNYKDVYNSSEIDVQIVINGSNNTLTNETNVQLANNEYNILLQLSDEYSIKPDVSYIKYKSSFYVINSYKCITDTLYSCICTSQKNIIMGRINK